MKIVRYISNGSIEYGVLEEKNIYKIIGDIFSEYRITEEKRNADEVRIIAPVQPPNIIAVGLNYRKHALESGHELPDRPVLFIKATSSVIGPEDTIILPDMAPDEVDFEAELVIVIKRTAKNIPENEVSDYILGYTCANDVSARDCQRKIDKQWARAKSFDTFCPLGPCIETELNPDDCNIKSVLNNKVMQDSNTGDMIFKTKELVSYISKSMTLLPGTVILTGTPEGVGFARKPPVFLKEGDTIEIEIEGIGLLRNRVSREY